jgi:hypothetical protein
LIHKRKKTPAKISGFAASKNSLVIQYPWEPWDLKYFKTRMRLAHILQMYGFFPNLPTKNMDFKLQRWGPADMNKTNGVR